jgi:acylphosphatase
MAGNGRLTVRLRITGRVQGVGYRAWCVDIARELGLSGWVRNRQDGSVEVLAHGPADAVEALVRAAQDGPPAARVVAVHREPAAEPPPPGFHQSATPRG